MRGSVLHFDEDQDFGYINGIDGKRYIFAREDVRQEVSLARGTPVEFQPDDRTAHNIVSVASTTSSSTGQPPGRLAEKQPAGSTGLWAYFGRTVSVNYFNFNGRARRKEFWAFWLCLILVLLALFGFGMLLNLAINGFDANGPGRSSDRICSCSVFAICNDLPSTALIVRRLHDVGLSGWFALLCFTPAIGEVALLVLGLIPSQFGENRLGSGADQGVRI